MKKIIVLLHILSLYTFGFSQCITTEDANNTASFCKFDGSGMGTEDSRTSKTIMTQAGKWMSTIFTTVIDPALKKTKGLRGSLNGMVRITKDDGLTPYQILSFMQELGCTKSQKLYEKDESGVKFLFEVNSLSGIATAITHGEYVLVKESTEIKTILDKVNGRQLYLLDQPTASEQYAEFPYYKKEDNGDKKIVVAKDGIPLFLPVSIKDVLLVLKNNYTMSLNGQNKMYTDFINKGEAGYLSQMDIPTYEATFGKEAAQKAKLDYIKTFHETADGFTKMMDENPLKKWISRIDSYLKISTPAQLAKPCIVNSSFNPTDNPITDDQFFDAAADGMQYITINPAYSNQKDPTTPQFVVIENTLNSKSAISLAAKKDFEKSIDFKKLQSLLGK
jgi:hypothetical protein